MIDSISLASHMRISGPEMGAASTQSTSAGADFSSILADVAQGTAHQVKAGEAAAISGLRGQMPIQDVVEAVMSAERSLQTALALRDKSVAAWQEISRMSI